MLQVVSHASSSAAGRRAVFVHPTGAKTWTYSEMVSFSRRHVTVKLHMCRYNLHLPSRERLTRKSIRLLVNNSEEMLQLAKTCPGSAADPSHACHDVVQGSAPGVPKVSALTAADTPGSSPDNAKVLRT